MIRVCGIEGKPPCDTETRRDFAMAVTLFTDRRMLDHRVPGPPSRAARAVAGDTAASRANGLS